MHKGLTLNAPAGEWAFPNRATPPGSSAYYSVRFAPAQHRDRLASLFGWRGEVRGVLARVSDVGVARLKLDWWRTEVERIAAGEPRHPLGLVMAGGPGPLPVAPMLALIDGVEAVLRGAPLSDDAAWRAAAEADRGALFDLLCAAMDLDDSTMSATARRLGGWCAQVRGLRDAGRHLRQGRAVLPMARLAAAGLTAEGLAAPAGRVRLAGLLTPLADRLAQQCPTRPDTARMPAVVRAQVRIHTALLAKLRASALAVADQRIGLTPLRKLMLAWRG